MYITVSNGIKEIDISTIYAQYKKLCESIGFAR